MAPDHEREKDIHERNCFLFYQTSTRLGPLPKPKIVGNRYYTVNSDGTYRYGGEQQTVKYRLTVSAGEYFADTLIGLMWEVFKHRLHHWRNGEGWVD